MPVDTSSIVIAGNGSVNIAPVGTALPLDHQDALAAGFVHLGYITEDGATFRDSKTREPITVWQAFNPVTYTVTEASSNMSFVLRQWDKNTVPLAFGGGSVEQVAAAAGPPAVAAHSRYVQPTPTTIDYRACVLEWQQDTSKFRLIIPKVMVTDDVETNLTRTTAADLPLTLGVIATDGAAGWTIRTNHPAWAA